MPQVHYLPDGKTIDIGIKTTLLRASLDNGIAHTHVCGGNAKCSTCRVLVTEGLENCCPRNEKETRLARIRHFGPDIRLACQTTVSGDVTLRRLVLDAEDVALLAADGVFRADGTFVPLPAIPEALLEGGFRRAVLDFLVGKGAISDELRGRMLGWRYSGFSVHNQVRVAADDAEGRKKLAAYMLRAPLSLAKMSYDPASGTVIYRSKMHLGLKRNFQVMPGAQWLELLCKHIPDRYEQLVRYCGWYSSRSRGVRKAKGATAVATPASGAIEVISEYASRAKLAWARLIRKVYEADPLVCPKCQGPMRVIALIEDPAVVRAILTHLGLWQPQALERAPPAPARAWPEHANLPLTYHPLPDIA